MTRDAPLAVNSATKVANLNVDKRGGKIFGDFGAQHVIGGEYPLHDASGPLPIEATFTSKGRALIIHASGSGATAPP